MAMIANFAVLRRSALLQMAAQCNSVLRFKGTGGQRKSRYQKNKEFLGMGKGLQQDFQTTEEIEDLEHVFGDEHPRSKDSAAIRQAVERDKRMMLKNIIQRKHFKPPQEVNLLTWDAKEQIRFLHAEYPDTWTVEQLAKSFPISQEGVVALLRSSWRPRSLKQLLRHDKAVQRRWLALQEGGHTLQEDGPLYSRYERLVEEGRLHLLAHATGIPSLPAPQKQTYLLEKPAPLPTDGPFAAIVKGYCQKKQAKLENKNSDKSPESAVDHLKASNVKLIGEVVQSSLLGKKDSSVIQSELKATYKDLNMKRSVVKDSMHEESLLDIDFRPPARKDAYDEDAFDRMQSKGHIADRGTVGTGLDVDGDREQLVDMAEFQAQDKYHRTADVEKFYADLQYDEAEGETNEREAQAYIYEEGKGYSYPFGRKSDIPSDIKVPVKERTNQGVYVKGKEYFDDDGEFLFKAP